MPELPEKSDQALLDDFVQRGLQDAFTELARRHQAMAFAAAYRICGDRDEARDILQQALIVLARRAPALGHVRCLSAWIHRVVILEARRARRTSANRRRRETMAYRMNEPVTEDQGIFTAQIAPELDRSLNSMSEKEREVLTLHYLEGRTFQSIAHRLGGTAEAWQKRSVRALQKLADKLRSRGVTVSAVALGAFLIGARAEAGVTATLFEAAIRRALEVSAKKTTGALGKAALLVTTMKTGIALSLATGMLIAYGWGVVTRPPPSGAPAGKTTSPGEGHADNGAASLHDKRERGFTLEMVRQAVAEYDLAEKTDPQVESRLRSLMFLVPEKALPEVFEMLAATKDHDRFQQIAGALFGCWAEYNPVAALARASDAGDYSYQAKRAVMVTWLNQDSEAALAAMLADKSKDNRDFLSEFVTYQCERTPREAAVLVDRIAQDWPEADRPLFERVAKLWSRSDALAAGDWVASYPDEEVKKALLKSMAVDVAKIRGFEGLAIADHIEDPAVRQQARNDAIYWWATTTAGSSLVPGQTRPVRDLSSGFPDDWTSENIRTFAQAAMVNYSKNLPDLLKIAKDDEQRMLIYEGAIKGSAWSDPSAVTSAAEQLPDSFAQTPQGQAALQVFAKRWNEMDPKGLESWLSKQPPGPKAEAMRASLKTGGAK